MNFAAAALTIGVTERTLYRWVKSGRMTVTRVGPRGRPDVTLDELMAAADTPRSPTCLRGHPWTEEDTYWHTDPDGHQWRRCAVCHRAAANERRKRLGQAVPA